MKIIEKIGISITAARLFYWPSGPEVPRPTLLSVEDEITSGWSVISMVIKGDLPSFTFLGPLTPCTNLKNI
jgi:hypothetical protein